MPDSAGVSNLNPTPPARTPEDRLSVTAPSITGIAAEIGKLVPELLTADEAAEKLAAFVDPSLVPALKVLATVLQAVEKYV